MGRLITLFDLFIYYPIFKITLILSALPARLGWDRTTIMLMRLNAKIVLLIKRGKEKDDIKEIGKEWKRMFPLKQMQHFISRDEDTVYYETHTWCPLRGTGNVKACYKLMEFDRHMLKTLGGEFVVLQSQAEIGVKNCKVAIREIGESTKDLTPAHERYGDFKKEKEKCCMAIIKTDIKHDLMG